MSVDQAQREIDEGFASIRAVLGDPAAVAPFFRIPGLLRQEPVERYLASRGVETWSVDFLADDWTHINSSEVVRRALARIQARGRGILLLHDIQPATAGGLPTLLHELKQRGFKIVHVVPATATRPATPSDAVAWVQRRPRGGWPRMPAIVLRTASLESANPEFEVPSLASFGGHGTAGVPVTLVPPDLSAEGPWPIQTTYLVPPDRDLLAAPAAQNFNYWKLRGVTDRKPTIRKPDATKKPDGKAIQTVAKPKDLKPNSGADLEAATDWPPTDFAATDREPDTCGNFNALGAWFPTSTSPAAPMTGDHITKTCA